MISICHRVINPVDYRVVDKDNVRFSSYDQLRFLGIGSIFIHDYFLWYDRLHNRNIDRIT